MPCPRIMQYSDGENKQVLDHIRHLRYYFLRHQVLADGIKAPDKHIQRIEHSRLLVLHYQRDTAANTCHKAADLLAVRVSSQETQNCAVNPHHSTEKSHYAHVFLGKHLEERGWVLEKSTAEETGDYGDCRSYY